MSIGHQTAQTLPEHLYHYTSIQGVEGILSGREVWASVLHFLNDSQEWVHCLELMKANILKRRDEHEGYTWSAFLEKLAASLDAYRRMNICVFSMSQAGNKLSQWRGYCPPEGGYAIQFHKDFLVKQLESQNFKLQQCIYESSEQWGLVQAKLDETLDVVSRSAKGREMGGMALEGVVNCASIQVGNELEKIAPFLKHPDFVEECEWRAAALVMPDDTRMNYHIRGSIAVPHCKIKLDAVEGKFPIDKIVVGPGKHQDLACERVSSLIRKLGLGHIGVNRSETPFRNM